MLKHVHLTWAPDLDAQWRAGLDTLDDQLAALRKRIADMQGDAMAKDPDPQELFDALEADVKHEPDPQKLFDQLEDEVNNG